MENESFENLGFTEKTSYKSEYERKKHMFAKLIEINKMADRNIYRMRGYQDVDNNIYNV